MRRQARIFFPSLSKQVSSFAYDNAGGSKGTLPEQPWASSGMVKPCFAYYACAAFYPAADSRGSRARRFAPSKPLQGLGNCHYRSHSPFTRPAEKVKDLANEALSSMKANHEALLQQLRVYLRNKETEFILFKPVKVRCHGDGWDAWLVVVNSGKDGIHYIGMLSRLGLGSWPAYYGADFFYSV